MGNHSAGIRNGRIRSILAIVSAVRLAITLLVGLTVSLRAQSPKDQAAAAPNPTPQWQIDAGGKMEFDVVSVKQDTAVPSEQTVYSNVSLTVGDIYAPNGGLFRATDFPLIDYMAFAYKITTGQIPSLLPQLPK